MREGSCQGEAKVIISLQRKFYKNEHREIRNRDRGGKRTEESPFVEGNAAKDLMDLLECIFLWRFKC